MVNWDGNVVGTHVPFAVRELGVGQCDELGVSPALFLLKFVCSNEVFGSFTLRVSQRSSWAAGSVFEIAVGLTVEVSKSVEILGDCFEMVRRHRGLLRVPTRVR